ncbi:hypothetical protein MFFC18_38310 [Mariniblastus fucicola]|uniref:Uncharacterized protein n=2 Tax=Mariniblastus fucicola TaxID=980251 RepID=A0A5B9PH32_9BACT|nr:hypothetical protein MFFC18_38310 [Mariniblastus fucicola]
MVRPAKLIAESYRQKDWFALSLLFVALVISCWIVSILFSQTTREQAMRRFQLASPSFPAWAAMAPVPSMYNFENSVQFTNEMVGDAPIDSDHESWFACPVNHFPARCVTFGEFSPHWFAEQKHGTFEMSTKFRESELIGRWEIKEQPDGTLLVQRYSENWVQHDAQ